MNKILTYRERGRPKLAKKRDHKVSLALTKEELNDISLAAANHPDGAKRLQDFIREILFKVVYER